MTLDNRKNKRVVIIDSNGLTNIIQLSIPSNADTLYCPPQITFNERFFKFEKMLSLTATPVYSEAGLSCDKKEVTKLDSRAHIKQECTKDLLKRTLDQNIKLKEVACKLDQHLAVFYSVFVEHIIEQKQVDRDSAIAIIKNLVQSEYDKGET